MYFIHSLCDPKLVQRGYLVGGREAYVYGRGGFGASIDGGSDFEELCLYRAVGYKIYLIGPRTYREEASASIPACQK